MLRYRSGQASASSRLTVTTSLDARDIAALRVGVAGLLLSPVLLRRGFALDRLGWLGLGTPFCARIAGLPLANIPKRAMLASQPPGTLDNVG
ncbi:MAG: hypothetical protein JOY83_25835 [Alphaproteobacteria bacterium]|nr:hypothetical protein [Alphaproteobacteria bacterium]